MLPEHPRRSQTNYLTTAGRDTESSRVLSQVPSGGGELAPPTLTTDSHPNTNLDAVSNRLPDAYVTSGSYASTQNLGPEQFGQKARPSFPRNVPELPNNNFKLQFNNAEEAREAAFPHRMLASPNDDVAEVKRNQAAHVRDIMRAIDSFRYTDTPKDESKATVSAEDQQTWLDYQKMHHESTRKILDKPTDHRLLEIRSWCILTKIIEVHESGIRIDLSKGDELQICSDRVAAVILRLKDFPRIRILALKDMDVERFVSHPVKYADEEVNWRFTNNNRPRPQKRKNDEEPTTSLEQSNAVQVDGGETTVNVIDSVTDVPELPRPMKKPRGARSTPAGSRVERNDNQQFEPKTNNASALSFADVYAIRPNQEAAGDDVGHASPEGRYETRHRQPINPNARADE